MVAGSGAITSSTGATDITSGAGNISLTARNGIGSSGASIIVSTTTGTLTTSSTPNNDDQYLQTPGTTSVNNLAAGTGTIHLTGGTFSVPSGSLDRVAHSS